MAILTHDKNEASKFAESNYDDYVPLTKEWAESSIPDRFQQQVAIRPDSLAVRTAHSDLTYHELNRLSTRVANSLSRHSRVGQQAVCILLEHDAAVPAAVFGILMSGDFYVALSANNPPDRNRSIVRDSGADLIITNDRNLSLAESLIDKRGHLINIDELAANRFDHDPVIRAGPDDIAYLVYTSGSTGQPKGVIQTHRNVLHNIMRQVNGWRLRRDDRVGLFFTYNFGASNSSLFGALLNGASLYPFDVKTEPPGRLVKWLVEEQITLIHTVPTFFRHLVSTMSGEEDIHRLRLIRLAGETIYGSDVRLFQRYFGSNCVLQVGLGSTETGTVIQGNYGHDSACPEGIIPLGLPTEDMDVLLLNEVGEPIGSGEIGEIAIRSRYLFAGYWRRPDLTGQALRQAECNDSDRIYFMGDLGSRLPDGRIMHLGRKDARTKIRGHRVELGEIERTLLDIPGVAEAAVIAAAQQARTTQLIAYVVRDESASMPVSSLRSLLKRALPDYMIPSAFVALASLPVTVSGKVDRSELAARPLPALERGGRQPRDHLDTELLALWEEILKTEGFGIADDFFELGGDSLLAMELLLRIEERYGRDINLGNFPTEFTVEILADMLAAGERKNLQVPILEIQGTGTEPPLYFCHGDFMSGGVFCRNLASHLGPDQPFFAIPPHGLDGRSLPQTIEAMAADRVRALRACQPDGPYRLGGFCWGGFLALEMARQIQEQGGEVDALMLIDSDPKRAGLRPVRRLCRRIGSWLSLSEEKELALFGLCRRMADAWNRVDDLAGRFEILLTKSMRLFARPNTSEQESAVSTDRLVPANRHARWSTYHKITQNYVPEPYTGDVILYRSSRLQKRHSVDPRGGWRFVTPDLELCSIEGDHWTCVTKHVKDVAAKMSSYLESRTRRN